MADVTNPDLFLCGCGPGFVSTSSPVFMMSSVNRDPNAGGRVLTKFAQQSAGTAAMGQLYTPRVGCVISLRLSFRNVIPHPCNH